MSLSQVRDMHFIFIVCGFSYKNEFKHAFPILFWIRNNRLESSRASNDILWKKNCLTRQAINKWPSDDYFGMKTFENSSEVDWKPFGQPIFMKK